MELEPKCRVLKFIMYVQDYDTIISERLKKYGIWEPTESMVARRYIKQGDTVVDVGAHIGYFTLLFSHQVTNLGQVFAFEPDPQNFQMLQRNVAVNDLDNVLLVRNAVSNVSGGPVKLYQTGVVTGHHSLVEVPETTDSIDVQQVSLDDYFPLAHKVDFVKIDTEGNEFDVIMGMQRIIKENPQLKIMLELNEENLDNFGHTPHDLWFLLDKFGFNVYAIDMQSKDLMLMTVDDFMWFIEYKEQGISYRNILAMRD